MRVRRRHLRRMPRAELDRFARWLRLRFAPAWSDRHLAALVYWRITRETDAVEVARTYAPVDGEALRAAGTILEIVRDHVDGTA